MSTTRSQNGWPLLPSASQTTAFTAGGRQWRAANPIVAAVAAAFLSSYARTVEPIDGGQLDDWSWAARPVRGSTTTPSNHWSATAWDVNALAHPRGVTSRLTRDQDRALRRLLSLFPVLKWGGDFRTVVDPMHFEICVTSSALNDWARAHIELLTTAPAARPTRTPLPVAEEDLDMDAATLQRLMREVIFADDTLNALAEAVWTRRHIGVQHPIRGEAQLIPLETALGRAASVIRDGAKAGLLHDIDDLAEAVLTHPIDDDRGTWPLADRVAGIDRAVNAPLRSAIVGSDVLVAPRQLWRQSDARAQAALQALSATQATVKQLVSLLGQVHGVDTATVIASVNAVIVDAVARVDDSIDEGTPPTTTTSSSSAAAVGSAS